MASDNSEIATQLNQQMGAIMNAENALIPMRARAFLQDDTDYPATLLEYVQHHINIANRNYEQRIDFVEKLNQLQTVIMSIESDIPYLRYIAGWQ